MALSNPGTSAALEPEPRAAVTTTTSPLRSSAAAAGFTAYASTVQDVRPKTNSQQQCSSLPRPSFNLDLAPFHHPSINEAAKEATTHDFLSLYGSTSLGGQTNAASARGTQSSVTLDFLQPLEKSGKVAVNSILSHALVPAPAPVNRVRTSVTGNHGGSQETGYALVNGTLELPSNVLFRMEGSEGGNDGVKERLEKYGYWSSVQLKFGSSDLAYTSKAMPSHAHLEISQQLPSNLNKQWHQTGTELFDTAKKPPRVPSEDDEDEDEDYPDRNRDQKKDCLFQRSDTSQKLDGKGNDGKASTPRSKHSATEQRRRSKINDRFQMLRQLVPNNDQKRDKASFLLEVIEYIQFLQEKVRKHEAAEHGRQQERLKNMSWDACQRSTGVRETTTDAPRMDSLVYGKEHIPIVSTVPFEMKQVTDANGLLRPRLSPVVASSDHEVSATDLPMSKGHVAMHLDRPSQAFQGRLPNNENKSVITKPIPATFSTEHSAYPMFGRNSSHMIHSGPKPASEAHTVPSCHENQGFPPITKSKVPSCSKVEVANLSQAAGNNLPPQILSSVGDQNQIELKSRQPESCQQDANSRQQNEDLSTVQHAGASPSARQMPNGNSTVSESSNDIHDTVPQKPESLQKVEVQVEGKQPLNIQGGVINVSSVYSQGLLNTLTRALQSSGLDLSQASISVQIDLGKPGDGVVATNSTKAAISPEVSQQAPGHLKHSRPSPESEHLSKKPKIEVDC